MSLTTLIIVGIIIYILYFIFKPKSEDDYSKPKAKSTPQKLSRDELRSAANRRKHEWTPDKDKKDNKEDRAESTFNVMNIPVGYEIYEDDSFFIHGVMHRFDACLKWAQGENHKISFKREANNKHDNNAIAIYGISSTGKKKLGYVAAEIADDLVYRELDNKIKARLLSVRIEETPFIEYEILVESEAYRASC